MGQTSSPQTLPDSNPDNQKPSEIFQLFIDRQVDQLYERVDADHVILNKLISLAGKGGEVAQIIVQRLSQQISLNDIFVEIQLRKAIETLPEKYKAHAEHSLEIGNTPRIALTSAATVYRADNAME